MTQTLAGDRPIGAPSEDLFGMSQFAAALAKSLLEMSPEEGLTLSVEAPWGAGKSSAIALTLREVKIGHLASIGQSRTELENIASEALSEKWNNEGQRTLHIVRFNPWLFSGQENLVRAFFKELEVQVGVKAQSAFSKTINKIAGYLPSASGLIGAGVGVLTGGPAGGGVGAVAGGKAGEVVAKAVSADQSLETLKEELSRELRKMAHKIIVIIDDLDRLLPSEMRAVFSMVKSLGDLPNLLYVLAFDQSVVHQALKESAEKIEPDFLEKIVQVSLKLPPPWRNELHQLLFVRLNAIIGDSEPSDQERWRSILRRAVDPYLETPRDVTRLANSIQVIWPNVAGDVDIADLVALTTIQLFDPKVYDFIRDEIESITHADYRYENDKDFAERMKPKSSTKPEVACEVLALLFPRIAKVWNKYAGDGSTYLMQREHRRICTKEYHRNYFVFGRSANQLSRSEINDILQSQSTDDKLKVAIERLSKLKLPSGASRVSSFLDQVLEAVYGQPLLTPILASTLLENADELIRLKDVEWEFFFTDNHQRIGSILRLGIQRLEKDRRQAILKILVQHPSALESRADIVEGDAVNHGLVSGVKKEWEQLFAPQDIEAAASAICQQVVEACKSGEIWSSPMPTRLMWRWWRMGDKEEFKKWIATVIPNPEFVVQLAMNLPNQTYRSDRNGSREVWTFDRKTYSDMFDVDDLYASLEALAPKTVAAKNALQRLREAESPKED